MTCRCVAPVDVTLYRNPAAAEGREMLLYFERKGVSFEDLDVTTDSAALQQMRVLSGQTQRSVVVVDGQVIVGFDQAQLEPLVPSRF